VSFLPRVPRRLPLDKMLRGRLSARQIAGRCLVVLGASLFAIGFIGSVSGAITLPYDRHHIFTQVVGLVAVATGFSWASGERR
jgi:hypothetical protein